MNSHHLRNLPSPTVTNGGRLTSALAPRRHAIGLCTTHPWDEHRWRCRWSHERHDVLVSQAAWRAVSARFTAATQSIRHGHHQRPKRSVMVKPRVWPGPQTMRLATRMRITRSAGSTAGIARQLAADGRRAAPQGQCNRPRNHALQQPPASASHSSACVCRNLLVIFIP
jgi:hypothetical protein